MLKIYTKHWAACIVYLLQRKVPTSADDKKADLVAPCHATKQPEIFYLQQVDYLTISPEKMPQKNTGFPVTSLQLQQRNTYVHIFHTHVLHYTLCFDYILQRTCLLSTAILHIRTPQF